MAQNSPVNFFVEEDQPEFITIKVEPTVEQVRSAGTKCGTHDTFAIPSNDAGDAECKSLGAGQLKLCTEQVTRRRERPLENDPIEPDNVIKKRRGRPRNKCTNVTQPKKGENRSMKCPSAKSLHFCSLCLRNCTTKLVMNWQDHSNTGECQYKLDQVAGIQLDLAKSTVCRICWSLVEMLNDFRICCQRAFDWAARYACRLPDESEELSSDKWFSEKTLKAIDRTSEMIGKRINRLKADCTSEHNSDSRDADYNVGNEYAEIEDACSIQGFEEGCVDSAQNRIDEHLESKANENFEEKNSTSCLEDSQIESNDVTQETIWSH